MPLTQIPEGLTDKSGAADTIFIDASNTSIAAASYGTDSTGAPNQIAISADGKSFPITVLGGDNRLIVTLQSPGPNPETVFMREKLENSTPELDHFTVDRTEIWTPLIRGA
jgi:hypothetical protein